MMLDGRELRSNLEQLCTYYSDNLQSPELSLMIAKIAVLELSGWIEECIHNLARSSVSAASTDAQAQSLIDSIIKSKHGIRYDRHVQPILSVALGAVRLTAIERKLSENTKLDELKSELTTLHTYRNSLAHTYTRITSRIDAPEITLDRFDRLLTLLREFSKCAHEK